MKQQHVTHLMSDYIDGVLDNDARREFERHIEHCKECLNELAAMRSLVDELHNLPTSIEPPKEVSAAVEKNMRTKGKQASGGLFRSVTVWKIAATLVLLIGTGVIARYAFFAESKSEKIAEQQLGESQRLGTEQAAKRISQEKGEESLQKVTPTKPKVEQPREEILAIAPADTVPRQSPQDAVAQPHIAEAIQTESKTPQAKVVGTQMAEGNSISGRVLDAATSQPLIGVNVMVVGTTFGTATDIDGKYSIGKIPPGSYSLSVSYIGYTPQTLNDIRVQADSSVTVDFSLNAMAIQMSEVVVTAEAPKIERNTTTTVRIQPNEAQKDALFFSAAKAAPQGKARGGRAGEVSYFIDGVRVEGRQDFNTEEYKKIDENEFKDALSNPLSTFSIDVDAASYSNVRRFINGGQLPPKDAVRIEEMINYFSYDYPQPKDKHPFSVNTELAVCPWNSENSLLLVGLKGKEYSAEQLAPSNLVFLIDVSGSMDMPDKLPLVQVAFRLLIQRLRPQDRVAIVVYAGNAGLVLPSTSGSDKETILEAVDRLQAGGSTAGGAGVKLAYKVARENFLKNGNNRVILATDGDFNVGVSSEGELVRMIEDERKDGVYLSVLGFGTGNYKDSKMEMLADKGNGNYAYIDDIHEARRVLVGQMAGTLYAIAKDVKIQIEFNPAVVKSYRLVGYENRLLNKEDFKDDKKDAGELGVGHTVTALYELVMNDGTRQENPDSLKYQTSAIHPESFRTDEALTLKLRYKPPTDTVSILMTTPVQKTVTRLSQTSRNFRFASSVAMFGMILRDSKYKERATYESVLQLAKGAQSPEMDSYKLEFIKLVETCRLLGEK